MARSKQLSVRFDATLYGQLEAIAGAEHRPIANQVVHFVAQGITRYAQEEEVIFQSLDDGSCVIEPWEDNLSVEEIQKLRIVRDSR